MSFVSGLAIERGQGIVLELSYKLSQVSQMGQKSPGRKGKGQGFRPVPFSHLHYPHGDSNAGP